MRKFQHIAFCTIALLGTFLFSSLTYYSCRFTRTLAFGELLFDDKDVLLKNLLAILLTLLFAIFLRRLFSRLTEKSLHVFAVCVSLLATLGCYILCKYANSTPVADQIQVYLAAEALYTGDTEWLKDYEYFRSYPFQLGLSTLYALFFRISGQSSYLVIQTIQSVLSGLSVYAGFRITRELFHKRQTEGLYLLLAICFCPLYFYSTYIYGESIGICCVLCAILCYLLFLKNKDSRIIKSYVFVFFAAFFLCVTYLVRSALLVIWIAMFLLQLMESAKEKKFLPAVLVLLILPLMLISQRAVLGLAETRIGSDYGDGCPVIAWVAMGAQDMDNGRGPGSYNDFNRSTYVASGYDREATATAAWSSLRESLQKWMESPTEMYRFFKEKILNQWNEPTYGAIIMTCYLQEPAKWALDVYDGKYTDSLVAFMNRYQTICFFALLGYFLTLLSLKTDSRLYLIGLILLGGFFFSLIWEAKSRYIYPYMVIALPCAAGGIVTYTDRVISFIRNRIACSHRR